MNRIFFRRRSMIRHQTILLMFYFCGWKHFASGTFTRVGNTYMKTPDSCCSIVPGETSKGCDMTSLHATDRVQLAYSPGFPNRFPIGRMCMWTVQCQYGYQVRLEFRDFYLIGPGKDGYCSDQYVTVQSPLTGHSMGRFCGNSGIPTIVSAGNLLVVRLHSEIPISSENFRGFAFVFRETLEAPNPEMRPGNWINHGQYSLNPRGIAKELLKLKPKNSLNSHAPLTTTIRNRSKEKMMPPYQNGNSSTDSADIKKTKIKKKLLKEKPPNFARPADDISKNSRLLLPLEVIVAICAGGVCGLALLILIACKVNQICKRKTQTNDVLGKRVQNKTEEKETIGTSSPAIVLENMQKQISLPSVQQPNDPMYPDYHNPYAADCCPPPMSYPMYYGNYSTFPNSERSLETTSTCISNTLPPPKYTSTYGLQPKSSVTLPLSNHANFFGGNSQLLLYNPETATGMLYNPVQSQQTLPTLGVVSTLPTKRSNSQHVTDYSDTGSDSSSSLERSRNRRFSKNKSMQKRSRKKTSTKKKKQFNSSRRRRRNVKR